MKLGINGWVEYRRSVTPATHQKKLKVLASFDAVRVDLEPKWVYGGDETKWAEEFWRPRIRAICQEGKVPLVILAYGIKPENDGWNVRLTGTDRDTAIRRYNLGIQIAIEECAIWGITPIFQWWNEPRNLNGGGFGFDQAFLDMAEYIVPRLKMRGHQLGCFSLHGTVEEITKNAETLIGLIRQGFTFVLYFDFLTFNYYPKGADLATYIARLKEIVAFLQKIWARPIELTEWFHPEREACRNLIGEIEGLRSAYFYGLIDPAYPWTG